MRLSRRILDCSAIKKGSTRPSRVLEPKPTICERGLPEINLS
jgi:hypothetical protein